MKGIRLATCLAACSAFAAGAEAQYYDNRVLDKAFEEQQIFFEPAMINPYGLSDFGEAAAGLITHPLLDLQVNPARLSGSGTGDFFGYLDFRRQPENDEPAVYPLYDCIYCREAVDVRIPYPYYGGFEREPVKPMLAAALFGRPLAANRGLVVGASYQLLFRDDRYYAVPYDIYRTTAVADFGGNRASAVEVPIVDGSSGENTMRTLGHLANLHVAATNGALAAGGRVGIATHTIDGTLGNQNAWTGNFVSQDRSFWTDNEHRRQEYGHLDVEFGLTYALTDGVDVGLSAGALFGSAEQELTRRDSSVYISSQAPPNAYSNEYLRGGRTDQWWDRDGTNGWAGLDVRAGVAPGRTVYALYRGSRLQNDLASASTISDSTFSDYDSGGYNSSSSSTLIDDRAGNGERSGQGHRVAAGVQWAFGDRSTIHIGVDVNSRLRTTTVTDDVFVFQHSRNDWMNGASNESWSFQLDGVQELHWRLRSRISDITVPVYLQTRLSDYVVVEFGLDRRLRLIDLTDVTTIRHVSTVEMNNGNTIDRSGTTEVYREPRVRESETTTAFLAGVSVEPSHGVEITVRVAPVHRERFGVSDIDWRWWIGFQISP